MHLVSDVVFSDNQCASNALGVIMMLLAGVIRRSRLLDDE